MKNFKLTTLLLAMGLSTFTNVVFAELETERSIVKNNGDDRIVVRANFTSAVEGDLYLAIQVNDELLFFSNEGQDLSTNPTPYIQDGNYVGRISLIDFPASDLAAGHYPLYQAVTIPGADPLNYTNWVGGLNGLSVINFSVGLPSHITGDFDGDGFSDDDHNRDGFHDDDRNRDGFHDDDRNRDGFHDDDRNESHGNGHEKNESHGNDHEKNESHGNGHEKNESHDNGHEKNESHDNGHEKNESHDNGHEKNESHDNGHEKNESHDNDHDRNYR